MNSLMAEEKQVGSTEVGSPQNAINVGPSNEGEPAKEPSTQSTPAEDVVSKAAYEELEKALGRQGEEIGEYRDFFRKVSPLLDKLDEQPELIQAILEGKIDASLAQSVLKGEVSKTEAEQVTTAHAEIKKDLGEKKYSQLDPKKIEELVESKINERLTATESTFKKSLNELEDLREFENRTNEFIKNTPDFTDYAEKIATWFEEHPDQDNIQIAYEAVKGRVLSAEEETRRQKEAGEAAKDVAANAAGGQSLNSGTITNEDLADKLIAKRSNPNLL